MTAVGKIHALMVEPVVTHLPPSSVIAKLDSPDANVRSTSMTVTITHARMAAVLMVSTPSSVTVKQDGLEISVTGLPMNVKADLVKMGVFVKSFQMDTGVDAQLALRERTVNITSMSVSPILASMETAQMASTGTSATAILATLEETVKWK
jgi:hypothetical protein